MMAESPYWNLPAVEPSSLQGVPIGGQWRIRGGILEGQRYGGAWHPIRRGQRGPRGVLLVNGLVLVPEA